MLKKFCRDVLYISLGGRARTSHLNSARKNVPSRLGAYLRTSHLSSTRKNIRSRLNVNSRSARYGTSIYAPSRDRTFLRAELRWDVLAPTRQYLVEFQHLRAHFVPQKFYQVLLGKFVCMP